MAYAFVFEAAEVDEATYGQLMKGLGREAIDAPAPAGFMAHFAGPRADACEPFISL